jgi:hypothetical protein
LNRWHRSSNKIPADVPAGDKPGFEQMIIAHHQFTGENPG